MGRIHCDEFTAFVNNPPARLTSARGFDIMLVMNTAISPKRRGQIMNSMLRRFISFTLALFLVLGMVPATALTAHAEELHQGNSTQSGVEALDISRFAGKKVSILGDSISTYTKISNNTSYNSTIGDSRLYYSYGGKYNIWQKDTWWQQIIDFLDMELCVNNSWSSSAIMTERAGTVGAYIDRCVQLHNDNTNEDPEVIWIFMGTNDFSYYSVGTKDTWGPVTDVDNIDYDSLWTSNGDGTYTYAEPATVYEAYAIMLHKMQVRYEGVEIYCMGLMSRRDPVYSGSDVGQPTEQNAGIKKVAEKMGCAFVDLQSPISSDPEDFDIYMGDKRVHPNDLGMDVITKAVMGAMFDNEDAACRIITDLTGVTSDSETKLLLYGSAFEAVLTKDTGLKYMDVTVTMGGKDITEECYANGKISIPCVTGDVQISALAYGDAEMYRWEINESGNDFVNVTAGDYTPNALTLNSGTITDGLFDNIIYKFATEIKLEHNKRWVIEWKSTGDWNGMLLSSSTSNKDGMNFLFRKDSKDLLALGTYDSTQSVKYQNYGIDTTSYFDNVAEHVYRLENRVNADGTNMVYLVVDNMEIGAMNNFYQSTTDKQEKVDWLSGQDLVFNYIGKSAGSHYLDNIYLTYLEIKKDAAGEHQHAYKQTAEVEGNCSNEGYYVYSCHCGDSYTVSNGQIGVAHAFDQWHVVDGQLRRDCEYCDAYETRQLAGYRWEMNEEGSAFVSISDDYNTENALELLNGSVSNGNFSQVQYQMADAITLSHESEWVIEWKSSGDWSGVLLSTTKTRTSGMNIVFRRADLGLGIGTYSSSTFYNYGINNSEMSAFMSGNHTFRLENRISADGSNMVYLVIDDIEIGAMNNYFNATTDKGTTNDWLNGQDLTFQFFGMGTNHYVKSWKPEYLQIWVYGTEHQHAFAVTEVTDANCSSTGSITYTCSCGETKTEAGTELGDHEYGDWQTVDGELRRYCKHCNGYETDKIKGYRWEYNNLTNSFNSVITDGNTQNDLKLLAGSVNEGVFSNVIYQFANEIKLEHDKEWIVEWKSSGDWNGMLLSSSTGNADGMNFIFRKDSSDLLALGTYDSSASVKYQNFGIDTTSFFDIEKIHVFRLENRVAADGSNMVYLVVDDIEIGAMNNYYQSTSDQKEQKDWLNGQDLVFKYMGKSAGSHHLNNIELSYLQIKLDLEGQHLHAYTETGHDVGSCIQEGVKSYVCYCGETTTMNTGVYGGHRHKTWTVVGNERQSTCELCGDVLAVRVGTYYDPSVSEGYYTVVSQKNYVLCDGVTEAEVIINNKDGDRRQVLHVVEVDAMNDNVLILPGYYGIDQDLTNPDNWDAKTTETTMDYYRDQLGYNVVAGMNTSLTYTSPAPTSFLVYNGQVLAAPGQGYNDNCDTYLAVTPNEDGTVRCELRATKEPLQGNELHALACNFGYTVKDGKPVYTNGDRSPSSDRSMIGIKADGTLVVVQSEGRNAPYSLGLTSFEMSETMIALGCVWAVNGDGGGSSQILTKREGESDYALRNIPSDGSARSTIASIIIASKAAPSGVFDHLSMLAESEYVTPGGSVKLDIKGVDGAGMPAPLPEDITYEATGGSLVNGIFTSDGTLGEQTVTAYYKGKEVGTVTVQVVIPTSISFDNAAMAVPYGKTVEIPISAYYGAVKVAISGADISFDLSAEIGVVEGLSFVAPSEENAAEANTAILTATLVHNTALTVTLPVFVGKGSEVLYDFEDQDLHGWYRSTASSYNAIKVGGVTALVDEQNGYVHSGDYAMKVELDYSNSIEPGWLLGTLVPGERIVLENALSVGMWVYFPDEADGLTIMAQVPVYASAELKVVTSYLTPTVGVADGGETTSADIGFLNHLSESGWHYITVDVSGAQYVGLPTLKFYVSVQDGENGYIYGEQGNVNGNFVLYVDDITVDYSQAVDDRESPVFENITYFVDGMDEADILNGDVIDLHTVSFGTTVFDNMVKNNYSGLDATSARIYIDGVDYTNAMTVSGLSSLTLELNNVQLSTGMHTVKFVVCDKMGNRSAIARTIIVGAADEADVKVVAHDPSANRILTGSLYYIDVVANNPESITSVTVTLDLNNISVWQLDHMEVAKGFKATYTLVKDENIATITITASGETDLSGNNQILASIPIRTWELPVVEPIYGHNGEVWMYDDYKATDSIIPMDLNVETDAGYVVYKDGSVHSFTSPKIQVMTELSGNAGYATATNYIGNEPWYADWNGGHDHRPETKPYYDESSTNHVDAIALPDKEATCTENGYTGRTYCEVCKSVVDWGTTITAGHSYTFIGGLLECEDCGDLFNGVYEGIEYVNGIVRSGWVGESYYRDGVKLTGVQKLEAPDGSGQQYYYDFGENGVCAGQLKYTGIFQDGNVYRYSYLGELTSGWQTIDNEWYYFSPKTMANVSGPYTIDGINFEFYEDGKLVSGVWVKHGDRLRYYFGPSCYTERWSEIDGEWYFFEGGYALTGMHYVEVPGYHKLWNRWYDFGENGAAKEVGTGFFEPEEGKTIYVEDGYAIPGLHKIGEDYYNCHADGEITKNKVYYAWATNCDLPCAEYEFGADGKMLNGLVEKEDGLYYYLKGKAAPSGLTKIGEDYYFVGGYGKCAIGEKYAWATNCDLPCGNYVFGADGKMLNPPVEPDVKNGIVEEADGFYYYVDGKIGPAGLTKVDDDYYFVGGNGKCATGLKYAWATNCDLPCAEYEFGADGKMLNGLVEKEDGLYYYLKGKAAPSGLTKIGEDYYFVGGYGKCAIGEKYAWATNCDLPCGNYVFGADGKMLNPPVEEPDTTKTYEWYTNLTAEEQTAYRATFESTEEFFVWYNAAKEAYKAQNPGVDIGNGTIDLGDVMNGDSVS